MYQITRLVTNAILPFLALLIMKFFFYKKKMYTRGEEKKTKLKEKKSESKKLVKILFTNILYIFQIECIKRKEHEIKFFSSKKFLDHVTFRLPDSIFIKDFK